GVLHFSKFEHLHFVCTPFDPDLRNAVAQMLHSILWSTLRTLSITDGDVDNWIQHLPSAVDAPRLLFVSIQGTDSDASQLSHASVLNIQQLIQANPQVELKLENLQPQDKSDWVLIVERVNFSLLGDVDMPACRASHLVSTTNLVDFFI
ncbi:hypothetical protein BG000_003167, partial [Podila horticola]